MIEAPEFVTNAITAIGIIARLVPITIAFHALAAFFPTHAPAIVPLIYIDLISSSI